MGEFHYSCVDCGKEFNPSKNRYLCDECSKYSKPGTPPKGVLKTVYNYKSINKSFDQLKETGFIDLHPINSTDSLPNLCIGQTPLYSISSLNNKSLPFKLYLKDDSQNPTFSFKDRASAIVSAFAKENEISTIITASTGNAGSSLAGICAANNQKAIVMVPESAPIAKITQIIMYGATIVPVKGSYDDAFDFSLSATKEFGWYNRNTAFNPLTIEGKKSVSFEIFDQLKREVPDRIFIPVGDGVIISGVYKGFEDLIKLGIIHKMPVIVAVQASGSNNLTKNLKSDKFTIKKSNTLADSISVDIPRNFYMTKKYIELYDGEWITVSDKQIFEASLSLSKNTGLFAEPAAAAAFAGFLEYKQNSKLQDESKNVVLLTGSGLKDINAVKSFAMIPEAIKPELNELTKFLDLPRQ
jgi:threonine synthase